MDFDVYLFLLSSHSFLLMCSSFSFKIELHIQFLVAVNSARSFCNVPCNNFCSCSSISLREGLGV